MSAVIFRIKINKIVTIKMVEKELFRLNEELVRAELDQFIVFNKAYLVVTTNISNGLKSSYFKNPEFIENLTICFASYYFRAINQTLTRSSRLPVAWSRLNNFVKSKSKPTFIYLLLGANAHINNDLPLALSKLMKNERTDDLLRDVVKVDKLLMHSGREIIGLFEEPNKILDLIKRRLVFIYYRPVMYIILYWRIKAWKNYNKIKNMGVAGSNYQKTSNSIAGRLVRLAALFDRSSA